MRDENFYELEVNVFQFLEFKVIVEIIFSTICTFQTWICT